MQPTFRPRAAAKPRVIAGQGRGAFGWMDLNLPDGKGGLKNSEAGADFYRNLDDVAFRPPGRRGRLGAEFLSGHLFTLAEDLRLEFTRKGPSRLVRREAGRVG